MALAILRKDLQTRGRARSGYASAERALHDYVLSVAQMARFDLFLSYSHAEAEVALGLIALFEEAGLRVYFDRMENPPPSVKPDADVTAERLRRRITQCRGLVYAATHTASHSKWMPWELGFGDGRLRKVAVFPISDSDGASFEGTEYLSLYPTIQRSVLGLVVVPPGQSSGERLGYWLDN